MPDLDIGITQITQNIVDGTTGYLSTFSPVFLFAGGFVLAIGIMGVLISLFTHKKIDMFEDDGIV